MFNRWFIRVSSLIGGIKRCGSGRISSDKFWSLLKIIRLVYAGVGDAAGVGDGIWRTHQLDLKAAYEGQ